MKSEHPRHLSTLTIFGTILLTALLLVTTSLQGQTNPLIPVFGSDGGPEASEGDPDGVAFGLPAFLKDDDPATDPSLFESHEEILPERYLLSSMAWKTPDYSSQEGALGWRKDLFQVPPSLATRVGFWKAIYSKYTTDQGVLHDLDDLTIVYEALDFGLIMKDTRKSLSAKARARTKLVKSKRDEISKRLERLSKMKSEKDIRDDADRKLLSHFTKAFPAALFGKERARELAALKANLKESSRKKRIRFQLGQRDKFILGIYYSGRYIEAMEKQFRAERLPVELTRLPFVESSFNTEARSRVGASGIWQFMPRTARPWMMVNRDVDERNDPMTATGAAARLMRSNYERLREWPLAMTAYNHGASGIARAVKKTGSTDIATIIEKYSSRRFGFASSNFYACFLAALEVEREARKYFGDVKWSVQFDGREIDLLKPLAWREVVAIYDGETPLAELQNPHLTKRVRSKNRDIPKGTFIRVPTVRFELTKEYLSGRLSKTEFEQKLLLAPLPRKLIGK